MNADDSLLWDVRDRIATVTLNRPRVRNALSATMLARLPQLMVEVDNRADVDVVILTGTDPSFCAGLDLKDLGDIAGNRERPSGTEPSGSAALAMVVDAATTQEHRGPLPPISKPLIGAINGAATTGGLELALACDFIVASEHASFADTHARVGVQPGWGMTVLLPQAVGLRRAREMSATGNFIDARTALQWGLVNHVVAHDDLVPFTRRLAGDIVSNDGQSLTQLFATYERGALVSGGEAWDIEQQAFLQTPALYGDPGAFERRRLAVMDRGRTQHPPR